MKMRKKLSRTVCLLVAVIMMVAMSTTTADAASFKSKPTGVKAKCVSGVSVSVSCKAKKGATGYCFYYATKKSGKYKLGAKSTKRTGTVKGLTPGKTYYFKVKAFKGNTKKTYSKMSKPVKCKTVLRTPGVEKVDSCCCRVKLKLSGSAGAKGYKIYRSSNKLFGYSKVGTTSSHIWIDENGSGSGRLNPSTTYYYKVVGYSGSYHSPYSSVLSVTTKPSIDGNNSKYNPDKSAGLVSVPGDGKNELTGRNILFLGSSITKGSASEHVSFADYIEERDGANVRKLAESGTNMANPNDTGSYVHRFAKSSLGEFTPDIVACQLSLNDSTHGIGLGGLPTIEFDQLDETYIENLYNGATTVGGAIAFITAYSYYNWPDCQVVFYTVRNNGYNTQYTKMRDKLYEAQDKYGSERIKIIDMWSMGELTNIKSDLSTFCLYMYDNNHPKKAGYLYQWTRTFEDALIKYMPPATTEPEDPVEPEQPEQPDGSENMTAPDNQQQQSEPAEEDVNDGSGGGANDGSSDGGSDGNGGSDGESNGGGSEGNDADITGIILSWLRAA